MGTPPKISAECCYWLNVPKYRHVARIFLRGVLYLNITCEGGFTYPL